MSMADVARVARDAGYVKPLGGDAGLAEQAEHAGRMLEAAYKAGDRELALIWQTAMFAIVNLRRSRRFGSDIQGRGDSCGG